MVWCELVGSMNLTSMKLKKITKKTCHPNYWKLSEFCSESAKL